MPHCRDEKTPASARSPAAEQRLRPSGPAGGARLDEERGRLAGERAREAQPRQAAQARLGQRLHPRVGLPLAAEHGAVCEAAGAVAVLLVARPVACGPQRLLAVRPACAAPDVASRIMHICTK